MVEVKVGDTFSQVSGCGNLIETRTVVKITDKSILFQNKRGDTFRVKNAGRDGYYMPDIKGFDYKVYFTLDSKTDN